MSHQKTIADQWHHTIARMLQALQSSGVAPIPEEYLVFKDPRENDWIILLFFEDAAQLNGAIRAGVAFQIHDFMWLNFNRMEPFWSLQKAIFFAAGALPEAEEELETIFESAIEKLNALKAEVGKPRPDNCSICGHDFGGHQLAGFPKEGEEQATRGWVMCKEEGCNCFRTWDFES